MQIQVKKKHRVCLDILSSTFRRRKWAYHLQEEERPYIALRRSRIPRTFQSFKGLGHHILKSSDRKKEKQVVNRIWKQLRNLLAKVHDKKPPGEIQPLLYIPLCSASSSLKCMGHRVSVTPLAWLLRVWEVLLVWGSFSFTSNLNVPFLEVIPLSFIL